MSSDITCSKCGNYLMRLHDDICGKCAEKLQARIAELEAMHDHQHLLDLADEMAKLQAENATLKEQIVTWHKYPDEKPDVGKTFLMYWITAYGKRTWMLEKRIDADWHWMDKAKDVVWAYLPEPPEDK